MHHSSDIFEMGIFYLEAFLSNELEADEVR